VGEYGRESPRIFLMEIAPPQLQPELQVIVQKANESSAGQHGSGSAYQTTPAILAEVAEEMHWMTMPELDGHRPDAMRRIRAVIDSGYSLSMSRNRYLEKAIEVVSRDRLLVPAIARDPHAARHIHAATGMPLATLYAWRDHLEVDATWIPWNHKVNHGSHSRKLNDIEEQLIEDALNERSARGEEIDRKLVRIVVRQLTLETRGVWLECVDWHVSVIHGPPDAPPGFHASGYPCRAPPRGGPARGGGIPSRRGQRPRGPRYESQPSDQFG
jgi:hypothetical protein